MYRSGRRWENRSSARSSQPRSSPRLSPATELVFGAQPVSEALRAKRRAFKNLFLREGDLDNPKLLRSERQMREEIEKAATFAKIPITRLPGKQLSDMVEGKVHQGIILEASPLEFITLHELPKTDPANITAAQLWLALEEITDPQNFGAILRSASFFGANGVITSEKYRAPLNAVVSKVSSGAMELLPIHQTISMQNFLTSSKNNGWLILGTGLGSRSEEMSSFSCSRSSVLVLGNEGHGLKPHILRCCDHVLRISAGSSSNLTAVDSLNVSVAAGVSLYHLTTSMRRKNFVPTTTTSTTSGGT